MNLPKIDLGRLWAISKGPVGWMCVPIVAWLVWFAWDHRYDHANLHALIEAHIQEARAREAQEMGRRRVEENRSVPTQPPASAPAP